MSSGNEPQPGSSQKPLDWMYKGPQALVDREEYLTGRTVDKALKMLDEAEKGNAYSYIDDVEKDLTPASIFANNGGGPMDVIRKVKEDPLYQIQKKEEEYLRQLLSNPVKMKQLRDLAQKKKAGEDAKGSADDRKSRKGKKHRSSSSSSSSDDQDSGNIDKILAQKLSSIKNVKDVLLKKRKGESSSSSSSSDSDDDNSRVGRPPKSGRFEEAKRREKEPYRRERDNYPPRSSRDFDRDRRRDRSRERQRSRDRSGDRGRRDRSRDRQLGQGSKKSSDSRPSYTPKPPTKKPIDETEREKKLREMMENAKWRETQRSDNVNRQREELKKEEEKLKTKKDADFIRKQLVEAAEQGSVEKRIKSNSYNIQRSKTSMNQNFARR